MHSSASSITTTVTVVPTTVKLAALVQHDEILPPPLIVRGMVKDSVGLAPVLQQQQSWSQIPSQTYANYAMGPSQVSFLSEFSLPLISYFGACYGVCFLLSGSHVSVMFTNGGLTIRICTTATPWSVSLGRHMYLLLLVHGPHQECTRWLLLQFCCCFFHCFE